MVTWTCIYGVLFTYLKHIASRCLGQITSLLLYCLIGQTEAKEHDVQGRFVMLFGVSYYKTSGTKLEQNVPVQINYELNELDMVLKGVYCFVSNGKCVPVE